jgi:hypothetical protein
VRHVAARHGMEVRGERAIADSSILRPRIVRFCSAKASSWLLLVLAANVLRWQTMENVFLGAVEGELVLKFVDVVQVFFSASHARSEREDPSSAPFSFSSTHVNGNYEPQMHESSHFTSPNAL